MVFERQKEAFFAQSAHKQLVAASGNRITAALKLLKKNYILKQGEEVYVPILDVRGQKFADMGMDSLEPMIL